MIAFGTRWLNKSSVFVLFLHSCRRLAASSKTNLFDEGIWDENNENVSALAPYCRSCDTFGHLMENCEHYGGQERTEASVVPQEHRSGKFIMRKLGRTSDHIRVISINEKHLNIIFRELGVELLYAVLSYLLFKVFGRLQVNIEDSSYIVTV